MEQSAEEAPGKPEESPDERATRILDPADSSVAGPSGQAQFVQVRLRPAAEHSPTPPTEYGPNMTLPVLPRNRTDYQVLAEIARGGMGIVYRARDCDLGRDVAVKILNPQSAARPAIVRRFLEEAQIGGQLQHPGIVPVYEFGMLADHRPYFSMKLVRGRTLADLLDERRSPAHDLHRFLAIFEQVCQAVSYAHARGVVHHDLKPANIMIGSFGEVQVMDWGIAKLMGAGGRAESSTDDPEGEVDVAGGVSDKRGGSRVGVTLGTAAYMAPEQARGEGDAIDTRTDVFALGGILLEILTTEPPFIGEAFAAIRDSAAGKLDAALIRLRDSGADEQLASIVRDCLAPDREHRPTDAGVLLLRISTYTATVTERARSAELEAARARARAAAEVRSRRLTGMLALVVVVAMVGAFLGWSWYQSERQVAADAAEQNVLQLLREANRQRGAAEEGPDDDPSRWKDALDAARRAQKLSEMDGVADHLRVRLTRLIVELERDQATAIALAERIHGDRRMSAALDELRSHYGEDAGRDHEQQFSAAYQAYGVSIEPAARAPAVAVMLGSTIAAELAAGLDFWALERWRLSGPDARDWRPLVELAVAGDPDSWRSDVRLEVLAGDVAALRARVSDSGLSALPVENLLLLARYLEGREEFALAERVYRAAARSFPAQFWVNFSLASLLTRVEPPNLDEALRYATAAVALRPTSAPAWRQLAEFQEARGDSAEATAARERADSLDRGR